MSVHITKTEEETKALAADFASGLKGGEVVELRGDLGSGKTTFVRGVVEALGSSARVKSPTFTVMNEYPVDQKNIKTVAHLDLYRFDYTEQIEALALEDYRNDKTIIFVEWPQKVDDGALQPSHTIDFEFVDNVTRKISLPE